MKQTGKKNHEEKKKKKNLGILEGNIKMWDMYMCRSDEKSLINLM
jgi:hypothetical protein